jgi:glycerophosphoryl diester phosphodiesterase
MTPLIIAHRGDSIGAPENTLAALRAAIDLSADGIEFDVRLAKDGVPVVIHDASLKRTGGLNEKVAGLTSAQLGKIGVGSWFNERHRKRASREFEKQVVPTLAGVMAMLDGFDGFIYVELKCGRLFMPLVDALTDGLRGSPKHIIVKSFRLAALDEVRRRLPGVETAALFKPSVRHALRRSNIVQVAREFGATQLSLHRSLVSTKLADRAHSANMPVTVWTVDDPKWIRRARKLGVKALITNDPARMLAARDEDS